MEWRRIEIVVLVLVLLLATLSLSEASARGRKASWSRRRKSIWRPRRAVPRAPAQWIQPPNWEANEKDSDCDDPDFCRPFESAEEGHKAANDLKTSIPAAVGLKFGPDVAHVWALYLDRPYRPNNDNKPVVLQAKSIVQGFAESTTSDNEVKLIAHDIFTFLPMKCLQHQFYRVHGIAKIPEPAGKWVKINIADILPAGFLQRPDMEFDVASEIPGNLAGGLGSCDVVKDSRTASGYLYLYGEVVTEMQAVLQLHFEINDCVSFCPGKCGLKDEQTVTVPASRVEAMGGFSELPLRVVYDAQILKITGIPSERQPMTPQTTDHPCPPNADILKFEEVSAPPHEFDSTADEEIATATRGVESRTDDPTGPDALEWVPD